MDSIKDFSKDIRVFRNMVERSISPKLYLLDKELNRLRALPPKCEERFLIKLYGKRHYKNPGFWGNLKAHGWDVLEKLDDFFKLFQGENLPYDWYEKKSHFEQRIEEAKTHEEELMQVTRDVTDFCERIRSNFVLDATLKYSERKKFYSSLDDKMYGSDAIHLLSNNDMLRFLLSIAEMEPPQKEAILESLSECAGFSFREAIIANDVAVIESYFEKLNDRYYPFAFEVSSLAYGLQDTNTIYYTIDTILEVCRSITSQYYIKSENAVKDLPSNLNALCPDLNLSLQQRLSLFTPEEVDAIQGLEQKPKTASTEEQKDTPTQQEERAEKEDNPQPPKRKKVVMLADHFIDIKPKFLDYDIMSEIADILSEAGYLEDTPDMKLLFIFRITGKGDPTPELLKQKIIWYLRSSHPNELNGFLLEIGMGHKNYREYISKFFIFATGKNEQGEIQYILDQKINPLKQHCNNDIIELLKQNSSLRILFEY